MIYKKTLKQQANSLMNLSNFYQIFLSFLARARHFFLVSFYYLLLFFTFFLSVFIFPESEEKQTFFLSRKSKTIKVKEQKFQ